MLHNSTDFFFSLLKISIQLPKLAAMSYGCLSSYKPISVFAFCDLSADAALTGNALAFLEEVVR